MKNPAHLPELLLGAIGVTGSLTLNEIAAVAVAAVTIVAMLPLAIQRWRRLFKGDHPDPSADDKPTGL